MVQEEHREPVRQAVGSAGQSADAGVARQLSELARVLQADVTAGALLDHVARARKDTLMTPAHSGLPPRFGALPPGRR